MFCFYFLRKAKPNKHRSFLPKLSPWQAFAGCSTNAQQLDTGCIIYGCIILLIVLFRTHALPQLLPGGGNGRAGLDLQDFFASISQSIAFFLGVLHCRRPGTVKISCCNVGICGLLYWTYSFRCSLITHTLI